jgi:putative oxidoreductase
MLKRFFSTPSSRTVSLLRVVLGTVMFAHGAQKLLGWFGGYGFDGTVGFFTQSLGIPAPVATLVVIAEFFGGLGLISGFLTRLSAAGIAAVMVGAIHFAHFGNGFFMNWTGQQAGEGYEYHLVVIALALALVVKGGGWASMDGVIGRRLSTAARTQGGKPVEVVDARRRSHA